MISTVKEARARKLCMNTMLIVVDYIDNHPFMYDPVELDAGLFDRLLEKVAFATEPPSGTPDILEFVVGRDVYHALTMMEEYEGTLTVFPEHFVKAGCPLFYKGLPVTTDAMFKPGTWILPPNAIFCSSTRKNGGLFHTRPCAIEVDIRTLDECDVMPSMDEED